MKLTVFAAIFAFVGSAYAGINEDIDATARLLERTLTAEFFKANQPIDNPDIWSAALNDQRIIDWLKNYAAAQGYSSQIDQDYLAEHVRSQVALDEATSIAWKNVTQSK
jgi:hypothetical protein